MRPSQHLVPLPKPIDLKKKAAIDAQNLPVMFVDDREAQMHGQIVDELELLGVRCERVRSDFGDYVFTSPTVITAAGKSPAIGIELSTVSDVVGKINDGRLAYQLSNMLLRFDVAYLMVSSPIQVDKEGWVSLPRMPKACEYTRLVSVLNAAQAHGVKVTYCAGSAHVPKALFDIVRYWSRGEDSHKYFRPQDVNREVVVPLGDAIDKRVQCLMSLPGIGEQRAIDALKTFGSVKNVILAGEGPLTMIPGWGKLTAKKVNDFLVEPIVITQQMRDHK